MSKVMIRYKVKPERAQENEQLIRAVYEELQSTAPAGLRYATFRMDDAASASSTSQPTRPTAPTRCVR